MNHSVASWDKSQLNSCIDRQDRFVYFTSSAEPMRCPVSTKLRIMMGMPGVTIEGSNCEWAGHSALSLCLLRDHLRGECSTATITWLLSKGANIDDFSRGLTTQGDQMNPLLYCSFLHNEAPIHLLLNLGADPNACTIRGVTPIHHCVSSKVWNIPLYRGVYSAIGVASRVIDHLVDAGADINRNAIPFHMAYPGYSPLACAIEANNEFAGLYLLGHNCDPSGGYSMQTQILYPNPLSMALQCRHFNFALILVMLGCPLDGLGRDAVVSAPSWVFDRLTNPQSLKDLCLASVRRSLRKGPLGTSGGGGTGQEVARWVGDHVGNGFRRFEDAVRSLPLPISLKRRVLMVGLRKLIREQDASFCTRGDRFLMVDGVLQSTSIEPYACHFDDDDDEFYDDFLM